MNTKAIVIIAILLFGMLTSVVYAFVQQTIAKEAERRALTEFQRAEQCEADGKKAVEKAQNNLDRAEQLLKKAIREADSIRLVKKAKRPSL